MTSARDLGADFAPEYRVTRSLVKGGASNLFKRNSLKSHDFQKETWQSIVTSAISFWHSPPSSAKPIAGPRTLAYLPSDPARLAQPLPTALDSAPCHGSFASPHPPLWPPEPPEPHAAAPLSRPPAPPAPTASRATPVTLPSPKPASLPAGATTIACTASTATSRRTPIRGSAASAPPSDAPRPGCHRLRLEIKGTANRGRRWYSSRREAWEPRCRRAGQSEAGRRAARARD